MHLVGLFPNFSLSWYHTYDIKNVGISTLYLISVIILAIILRIYPNTKINKLLYKYWMFCFVVMLTVYVIRFLEISAPILLPILPFTPLYPLDGFTFFNAFDMSVIPLLVSVLCFLNFYFLRKSR